MSVTKVLSVLPVADFDAAVAWYEKLFGRPADVQPMPGLADWHITDTAWVQVFRDPDRAGRTSVNLAVAELAAHTAELEGRGIAVGESMTTATNVLLAAVTDPAGNVITFMENPVS